MRRKRSPLLPTSGVSISMASSGVSALGLSRWCTLAGPPWTLGPVSPISLLRRRASSSPCSRMMCVRSVLSGALPASCITLSASAQTSASAPCLPL